MSISRLKYSYDPLGLLGYRELVISDKEYKKYDAGTTQFEFNLEFVEPTYFTFHKFYEAQGIIKIDSVVVPI